VGHTVRGVGGDVCLEAESGNGHVRVLFCLAILLEFRLYYYCVNKQAFFTVSICKIATVVLYSGMNWSQGSITVCACA
jgi:hypothetical protein